MLRVLDLFSGIGGFSLGLERTGGFQTVAFCEIEQYPRQILAQHWPGVPIYDDVRELTGDTLSRDGIAVDVICGGFPCQDISFAGAGAGLAGERSGLWREYARLIGELRPRYVLVENVAALLARGLGDVLGDLAALGYDAEWHCIPASAVGAPHRRDRIWIIGHTDSDSKPACAVDAETSGVQDDDASDASSQNVERQRFACRIQAERSAFSGPGWWETEPDVGRVDHGVPARVDRLKGLGNAVVPQIPELIGRAILATEKERGSVSCP